MLILAFGFGFCLLFSGRFPGVGRLARFLDGMGLSWLAHLGSLRWLRRSNRLRRHCSLRWLCRSSRLRWHRSLLRCRLHRDRRHRSRRNFSLPLNARLAARRRSIRRGRRGRQCLGSFTPLGRRRWRWWWWRRRQRLEIFQSFRPRAQLAIQQQHEHIVGNLRIRWHLRRDVEFRHLRQRNLLLHLPPLGKEILDLLRHRLLPRRDRKKQNHLRTSRRQQLPSPRGCGRLFTQQALSQAVSIRIQILPRVDQILAWNRPPQIRNILVAQPLGQEMQHRRRNLRHIAEFVHLLTGLHQRAQSRRIHLGRAPARIQHLQPALFFVCLQDAERIVLVRQLLDLVSDARIPDVLDVSVLFCRFVTRLCSLLERPVETCGKSC